MMLNGGARLEDFRLRGAAAELAGVVVAQRDSSGLVTSAAAGCAQFAADGRCRATIGPNTLLRVASISKFATTLAVMRLVERGQLDLDRDVSDYLGYPLRNPGFPAQSITLRQLLSHSSSLIDVEVYWAPHPQTLRQLLAGTTHFDTTQVPGSCYRYTNLNFGVIGGVLERVSGQRFDRLMQREVFAPLHIEAGFNWSGLTDVPPGRVGGIWRRPQPNGPWQAALDDFGGGPARVEVRFLRNPAAPAPTDGDSVLQAPPVNYDNGSNGTLFSPQGGMRISVLGLLALGAQLLPASASQLPASASQLPASASGGIPRLLSDASIVSMIGAASPPALLPDCDHGQQPASRRYGLGIELLQFVAGEPIWAGHFGEAYGLRSMIVGDREHGTLRAYIINGSAQPLPDAAPPYVEMNEAEAALLKSWPLSQSR